MNEKDHETIKLEKHNRQLKLKIKILRELQNCMMDSEYFHDEVVQKRLEPLKSEMMEFEEYTNNFITGLVFELLMYSQYFINMDRQLGSKVFSKEYRDLPMEKIREMHLKNMYEKGMQPNREKANDARKQNSPIHKAKPHWDEWQKNLSLYKNQKSFIGHILDLGLCGDESTVRRWIKKWKSRQI